jgi:Domain of unknown function (DUF3786)
MNRLYGLCMLPKQENLPLARRLSVQALLRADLAERAVRSGSRLEIAPQGQKKIGLRYLGRELFLSFPQETIEPSNGSDPVSLREEILILHYLEKAAGTPLTGKWISFAEIPGGTFYHPVFLQRCKAPLVKYFGESPESLLSVAVDEVRGEPWSMGDAGVKIQAFPFVALGLVLWKGDTEFPPDGNVLFDSSITGYLPAEDVVILAETVVWKLIKAGARLRA